jgi:lyso-ornithine lipid O-acyltransferase
MWIGSPLRGAFRLMSYLSVTLVLVPIYLVAMALRIQPVIRWMPVAYHRFCSIILGIKVRVHGQR